MMDKNKQSLGQLNNNILCIMDRIKELYEVRYPAEYKVILKNLTGVSKELTDIQIKELKNPLNNKTDENNKSNHRTEM